MFAAALLMLSLRTLTDVSMDVILPALFLQGLTVPFVMAQVAGMTFVDFTEDDFQHAYAFKNIVRQIATAAGTGAASLWLQYGGRSRARVLSIASRCSIWAACRRCPT